ncbi:hypothetical protein BH09VER1_BH09VER1_31710 [soil metagenome]
MITQLADNLWMLRYPLKALGADLRRNVTLIRLASGDIVIHSTGPFTAEDVDEISRLGRPAWLVDSMLRHDTFAREGRMAFPNLPYLAPSGFSLEAECSTTPLLPAPIEWGDELLVLEVLGMPEFKEYLFFHPTSRTLIVADLAFNFGSHEPWWTELLLHAAIGSEHHPGMSKPFKAAIVDEVAFRDSMRRMLAWNFDRVVVGHGDVIETGGHEKLTRMLAASGF